MTKHFDPTNIEIDAPTMDMLWKGLSGDPIRAASADRIKRRATDIAKAGAILYWQMEDAFSELGLPWEFSRNDVLKDIGVPQQSFYFRPRKKNDTTSGCRSYRAADFASGLIQLERLGFRIDLAPFVEAVLPSVRQHSLLSWHELNVFWFTERRHRASPMLLRVPTGDTHFGLESLKLSTGYKVDFDRIGGDVRSLQVTAPRYRKPRSTA